MAFRVFLTDDAARDLHELYEYIERHDVKGKADHVLEQIEKTFTGLSEDPHLRVVNPVAIVAEYS